MSKVTRKRDANATRIKIITISLELFAKKGYDAVSVDEIANSANINKAMIYYYYKSKSGLYEAVMKGILDDIYNQIITSKKCCDSVLGELKSFITTYVTFADKYPYFPALLLRELSDSGAHLPETIFDSMKKLFQLLSDILKKGEQEGIFKEEIPIIVHFMIIGAINLYITTKPLRKRASEDGLDTCYGCDIVKIAEYIYKKVLFMLEVEDKKQICIV